MTDPDFLAIYFNLSQWACGECSYLAEMLGCRSTLGYEDMEEVLLAILTEEKQKFDPDPKCRMISSPGSPQQ